MSKNNIDLDINFDELSGVIDDVVSSEDTQPKELGNILELNTELKNATTVEVLNLETPEEKKNLDKISEMLGIPYSDEQREIIRHFGKPLNIVSCAGSGKTAVLIGKMLYTQLHYGIKAYNMLGITFNTQASIEIKERYQSGKLKLGFRDNPEFRTFHSLFLMLLRSIDKYKNIDVISHVKYNYELLNLIRKPNEDSDKSTILDEMMSFRGVLINNGHSLDGVTNCENFQDEVGGKFYLDNYIDVITLYNNKKKKDNAIDFDDMIVLLYNELYIENNVTLVENFQAVFKYIYIDEYQDISKIQIEIMDKLIEDVNKLVTIGDDDQAIYSFRGSNPSYIRDFLEMYEGAERLHLSTNYRCKKEILDSIIPSIESNQVRVPKKIQAFEENLGGKVFRYAHSSYDKIANVIHSNTEDIYNTEEFSEHAILVRTNNLRMILTDILVEQGVQVDIGNLNYSLRKNSAYRSLVGIIKAIKEESNICFSKYMRPLLPNLHYQVFKDYAKNKTDKSWYEDIVLNHKYKLPQEKLDVIEKIRTTASVSTLSGIIWKEVKPYYEQLEKKGFGNVKKVQVVYKHVYNIGRGITFPTFLESELRKENFIKMYHNQPNTVKIHTFHSVKGLEFNNVYLVGLNNDIVPDENYISSVSNEIFILQTKKDKAVENSPVYRKLEEKIEELNHKISEYIEEERRLFYVAWTRAKNELHFQYNPKSPSMFIKELDVTNVIDV